MEQESMTPANKTFKPQEILDNPAAFAEAASSGGLGRKLALLRLLSGGNVEVGEIPDSIEERCEWLGRAIINEMLDRQQKVDHREHWVIAEYLNNLGFEIVHLNTGSGDISTRSVSVERKEDDFLPSLFDDRRLRQLGAMREEAEFSYLIVTKSYQEIKEDVMMRDVNERILLGYIASLCAVGYPPLFIPDKHDAAELIKRLVDKIEDDDPRVYVPRPKGAKPSDYRNAMIESLPKIGVKTRRRLVESFPNLASLANASVEEIMAIDGIGKKTAEKIHRILHD
jgi:ERCC4-type nuclease